MPAAKKPFNLLLYQKSAICDLIIFGIYSVLENKGECTFERLTKECFSLFSKAFSFSKYSQWPDARKLDRPLRDLRKKKLIVGDPATSFSLTKTGKKLAEEIGKRFRQKELFK